MSDFQGMASSDPFALGIDFVVLVAVGLGILLSVKYIPNINQQMGEYYALLLLISAGMMAMGVGHGLDRRFRGAGDLFAGAVHP